MTTSLTKLNEKIITCNEAGLRILNITEPEILQKPAIDFFVGENEWLMERITKVQEEQQTDTFIDASYQSGDQTLSLNGTVAPLISTDEKKLGVMVMLELMVYPMLVRFNG